nr:DUF3761 domain-containing protein [Mycobacterium tuberculosis]
MYSVRFAGTRSRKRDDRRLAVSARRRFAVGVVAAAVGFGFVPAISPSTPTSVFACPSGYYEKVDGQCIPAPRQVPPGSGAPPGATAICRDGSYSFSTHRSGTCSRHGGVLSWLA